MGIFDFVKEIPLSAVLREKLKDIESEVNRLREENKSLREQDAAKARELVALNDQVRVLTSRLVPTGDSRAHEIQERLLLALAEHEDLSEETAASLAQVGKQVAAYHLEVLRQRNFVHASRYAGSSYDPPRTEWSLAHSGREYLIRCELLK